MFTSALLAEYPPTHFRASSSLLSSSPENYLDVAFELSNGLRSETDKGTFCVFSQDLILDQTIEKVSFCAPDRNFERAFSYICRDGTTRRWICHCFMAVKDSVSPEGMKTYTMRETGAAF